MYRSLKKLIQEKENLEQELRQVEAEIKELKSEIDCFYSWEGHVHSWEKEFNWCFEKELESLRPRKYSLRRSLLRLDGEINWAKRAKPKDILMRWGVRFVY